MRIWGGWRGTRLDPPRLNTPRFRKEPKPGLARDPAIPLLGSTRNKQRYSQKRHSSPTFRAAPCTTAEAWTQPKRHRHVNEETHGGLRCKTEGPAPPAATWADPEVIPPSGGSQTQTDTQGVAHSWNLQNTADMLSNTGPAENIPRVTC